MKKVVLLVLAALSISICQSQEENNSRGKKIQSGFFLGVNYSNLILNHPLEGEFTPNQTNSPGFELGILGEFRLSDHFDLRASSALSFNGGLVRRIVIEDEVWLYERREYVMPISLDGSLHAIWNLKKKGSTPYTIFGFTGKMPLKEARNFTEVAATNSFVSADIGIGFDKEFTVFNFSPELRYSYALNSVTSKLFEDFLYLNQVSLILNFKG